MKKIILTLAMAFSVTYAFAQVSNTTAPEEAAKIYFDQGKSALDKGDAVTAGKVFAQVSEIENGVFELKNKDTKAKEYYYTEAEAKKVATSGNYAEPKAKTVTATYGPQIEKLLNDLIQKKYDAALAAYNSKDYGLAAQRFEEIYELKKGGGSDEKDFLYKAGNLYYNAKNYTKATELYSRLINDNYNGVMTTYFAVNSASGQKENFGTSKQLWEDFKSKKDIRGAGYKDYTSETTEDISKELYEFGASSAYENKDYNKAIEISEKGLGFLKSNQLLSSILANSYMQLGNVEEAATKLRAKLQANPNDVQTLNILGNILSNEKATTSQINEAVSCFDKIIAIDSNNAEAYAGAGYALMRADFSLSSQLTNNLLNSSDAKDKAKVQSIISRRKSVLTKALPYLEKAEQLSPGTKNNLEYLRVAYSVLDMDAKKEEVKQKLSALKDK